MVETIVPFNCLSVTRFHYYIFYLGKDIIAALVHWVKFAFHLNFTHTGISDECLLFCHQTGMVGHCISQLHTSHRSAQVEFKTLSTIETLTPKHIEKGA